MRSFGSDNHAPAHPKMVEAIGRANADHELSYGDDSWSVRAREMFRELFGDIELFFVFNGTGANVTALGSITRPFNSVICAETAHINVDECGAPEHVAGIKLVTIKTEDGKLTPELVKEHLHGFGFCHHAQPKVISVSQTTELGTLYTFGELRALADLAHAHGMYLHVDGSRFANSIAALGENPADFATLGVDVLSFGGTKNGLVMGEAVVFFNKALAADFPYVRKQSTQLYSKMRYVAAQFCAYLEDGLWLRLAAHANRMAALLCRRLQEIPEIRVTRPCEANALFLMMPEELKTRLRERYFFYDWDETTGEARLMTSFDTAEADVENFVGYIRDILNSRS